MVDVLFVDDEPHLRTSTGQALELAGLGVETLSVAEAALPFISRTFPGILITDVKMPGMTGLELMSRVLEIDRDLPVILVTGHGDVPMAVEAMSLGAYTFIEKPFAPETLAEAARRALEKRRLVLEIRALKEPLESGARLERTIIGRSPGLVALREQVAAFGATDADVLLLGETGTGKELVARSLHETSLRAGQRFVAINCGALPDTVIESELFGHEAGAFTGATKAREGKFEYASGGTLFLDEIESMPLDLQAHLLRVLQDRRIVRLGANAEIPVDIRVIAASKEDLREASDRGSFRRDLFYRLNVLMLRIPPLRERREDVPLLFSHFASEFAARFKREARLPSAAEIAALIAHDWPGNVRELQNVAMRAALGFGIDLAEGRPRDGTRTAAAAGALEPGAPSTSLPDRLAALERIIIQQTLERNGGSMKATYEELGIARKTLYDKLRKYGISEPPDEPA